MRVQLHLPFHPITLGADHVFIERQLAALDHGKAFTGQPALHQCRAEGFTDGVGAVQAQPFGGRVRRKQEEASDKQGDAHGESGGSSTAAQPAVDSA